MKDGIAGPLEKLTLYRDGVDACIYTTHTHAVATKTVFLKGTPHPHQSSSWSPDPWVGPCGKGTGPTIAVLGGNQILDVRAGGGVHHACGGGEKSMTWPFFSDGKMSWKREGRTVFKRSQERHPMIPRWPCYFSPPSIYSRRITFFPMWLNKINKDNIVRLGIMIWGDKALGQ